MSFDCVLRLCFGSGGLKQIRILQFTSMRIRIRIQASPHLIFFFPLFKISTFFIYFKLKNITGTNDRDQKQSLIFANFRNPEPREPNKRGSRIRNAAYLERCQSWEKRRKTWTLLPCMEACRLSATTFSTYLPEYPHIFGFSYGGLECVFVFLRDVWILSPESCHSQQARYQLSQKSPPYKSLTHNPYLFIELLDRSGFRY